MNTMYWDLHIPNLSYVGMRVLLMWYPPNMYPLLIKTWVNLYCITK